MPDYKDIFDKLESTLFEIGSHRVSRERIKSYFDKWSDVQGKVFSDDDYYKMMVHIIFYAGFRASTVERAIPFIDKHFQNYRRVAGYGPVETRAILDDPQMIKNVDKIIACVENAKVLKAIIDEYGSIQAYIDSFRAAESEENLCRLRATLRDRFHRFGLITPYHFMTDIGLNVLKPDVVVCRIFKRLGLIEKENIRNDNDAMAVVKEGWKFSNATGHPIRYIDLVFVTYGQVSTAEVGLERGICLLKPRCNECGIKEYCHDTQQ